MQQALGSGTYHSLRLNQDPLYLSATAAAQQAGIPARRSCKLYEINRATQAELDRIRNDTTLFRTRKSAPWPAPARSRKKPSDNCSAPKASTLAENTEPSP